MYFAEDFANDVELTEEQQILLLEEYEKEISNKKHKQTSSRDLTNNNMKNKITNAHTGQKTKAAQTRDKMNNKQNGRSPKKAGNLTFAATIWLKTISKRTAQR